MLRVSGAERESERSSGGGRCAERRVGGAEESVSGAKLWRRAVRGAEGGRS